MSLKEKQSCLSSENTEDVSNLALLQAVLKCKTGVGVKNFSPRTETKEFTQDLGTCRFIDMVNF